MADMDNSPSTVLFHCIWGGLFGDLFGGFHGAILGVAVVLLVHAMNGISKM